MLSEDSLWLFCFLCVRETLNGMVIVVDNDVFLILCKCSLTYRNHIRKNFSETVKLFLAVSRWRWCVSALISWGRNQRRHTPSPQIDILIVVFDYIYRYLWSYQHKGDVSLESYVAWASKFTYIITFSCLLHHIHCYTTSLILTHPTQVIPQDNWREIGKVTWAALR